MDSHAQAVALHWTTRHFSVTLLRLVGDGRRVPSSHGPCPWHPENATLCTIPSATRRQLAAVRREARLVCQITPAATQLLYSHKRIIEAYQVVIPLHGSFRLRRDKPKTGRADGIRKGVTAPRQHVV